VTRHYVIWQLQEAAEAVAQAIEEMSGDPNYSDEELRVQVTHIYHHLNTAWNARHASDDQVAACSQEDFNAWRKFPSDIEMET
jgi:hypothetical protein